MDLAEISEKQKDRYTGDYYTQCLMSSFSLQFFKADKYSSIVIY